MVKAKLHRQNHPKKHTDTHSQKEKKGKNYICRCSQSPLPSILGWFIVYSGIPQRQGTSSWLWRFNPLLLRLLGEISLSLLCLHSSWVSALDLALPVCVGHLRVSVPHPDRTGLKQQQIGGLWLRLGGGRGTECWVSLRWQMPAWRFTSLRRAVCSHGEVVPGSWDPGSGGLHRLPGGQVWIVTCACTQGSVLIAKARAHLWSSFRRCSESPLLVHPETMVSCLLGRSRLFPGLPPG